MYLEASLRGLKFKASGGLGGLGGRSPPHLQTECSHDGLRKHSLKQACAAQKKARGWVFCSSLPVRFSSSASSLT